MQRRFHLVAAALLTFVAVTRADTPATRPATTATTLFNGWRISPAGTHAKIESMPLKMIFSPNGKYLAAVCGGLKTGVAMFDAQTHALLQFAPLPRCWNGIAFSHDGKHLFVSGGNSRRLFRFDVAVNGKLGEPQMARLGVGEEEEANAFLSGVAVHPRTGRVYVCNEAVNEVWVVDPNSMKVENTIRTGAYPHSCVVGANLRFLYVSNWGGRSVSVIDTELGKHIAEIRVGIRPNDMALAPDGRLFVACAGDNTLHVIRTQRPEDAREEQADETRPPSEAAHEIISTSLYPQSPEGSTPDGIAITPDGKTLYAVNSDNNDAVVVDISEDEVSVVRGFIPTGWYPTAVAASGRTIFVANGKGLGSRPSFPTEHTAERVVGGTHYDHPTGIIEGWVSFIDTPTEPQLGQYTLDVRHNSPYTPECFTRAITKSEGPIPDQVGEPCPIKHVLYIIKENRTYDQVLGDLKDASGKPLGNGDPNLVFFGEDVSPNHHQLAREYALFDNLYCNSEVSLDGHSWCDGAIATDFRQRQWTVRYTKHGQLPGNDEMSTPAEGWLWDLCKRHGVSFKCYGEGEKDVPKDNRGTWLGGRDMQKVDGWIGDLKKAETTGDLPRFMIMSLGEDHTRGTKPGEHTPQAMVASNDIALGKIVAAASRSKFWKEMAIFVIEDDAQNGPDHVDAHRTVGFVISPYIKRGMIDSTPYTTTSMVRTMELILGLPPLTQYDGGATPMFACFQKEPLLEPAYEVRQPKVDLNARNGKDAPGAAASARMDFDEYDEAPEDELNRVLWRAIKGPDVPYATPIHRAVFTR
jgi:YVTN family beta-propeller protein